MEACEGAALRIRGTRGHGLLVDELQRDGQLELPLWDDDRCRSDGWVTVHREPGRPGHGGYELTRRIDSEQAIERLTGAFRASRPGNGCTKELGQMFAA